MYERRRVQILRLLEEKPILNVSEISSQVHVSEMTVRRDLMRLEQEGVVRRSFGEVSLASGINLEQSTKIRATNMTKAKKGIAQVAARLVPDGCAVFLDAGSTICELSRILAQKPIIIATASIKTASIAINREARVFLSGGELDREEFYNLEGSTAENFFHSMSADYAFVSAGGVDLSCGITEYTQSNAHLKRVMLERAKTKVLLADSSKFEEQKPFLSYPLEKIDILVTDKLPPEPYSQFLEENKVRVYATETGLLI